MRNIAKIALIVFVSMLEVGYAVDCRNELYEKYKAHSAEFIKLKNKCKPLLENVKRLADTYTNRVEFKEYEAIYYQYPTFQEESVWVQSAEYRELARRANQCINSPEQKAKRKRTDELEDIYKKTQAYKVYKQAEVATTLEISATCRLFLDGVYDIDRAFERITKATYKLENAEEALRNTPQNRAFTKSLFGWLEKDIECQKIEESPKYKAYRKALEAAEKALEPLQTAFRNSQEVKEYEVECRGITFPAGRDMKDFDFEDYWDWRDYQESQIISYIQSIIANRP